MVSYKKTKCNVDLRASLCLQYTSIEFASHSYTIESKYPGFLNKRKSAAFHPLLLKTNIMLNTEVYIFKMEPVVPLLTRRWKPKKY